jgi:hypothetical protein
MKDGLGPSSHGALRVGTASVWSSEGGGGARERRNWIVAGPVHCFIDAIFGHSLGLGVSTRAGRGHSSPNFSEGRPGWSFQ